MLLEVWLKQKIMLRSILGLQDYSISGSYDHGITIAFFFRRKPHWISKGINVALFIA